MTTFFQSSIKRALAGLVALACVLCVNAVPAYPKWQVKTLQDGSSVKVRLSGDEWYHYWETEDGLLVEKTPDGAFVKTAKKAPSQAELQSFRQPKYAGTPFLPSKGLVVLVNCTDSIMRPEHTQSVFNDFCNATNCTTNVFNGVNYGSAAQYFSDQSNGAYRPTFDVYGPVNLTHPMRYYAGTDGFAYMADFVIEAVEALDVLGCDFSQYDLDQDGYVDFIFFIYAGIGLAYGGQEGSIWPHQYYLSYALANNMTHGGTDYYYNDKSDHNLPVFDGKKINMYACSSELFMDSRLAGIGVLCHEFSHVMGLPDYYNASSTGGSSDGTPGAWDVMDAGAYNGYTHCPPNYNAWSKAFFDWTYPVNLGNENSTDTLYAAGSENYNVFQVNQTGIPQAATAKGVCYYLEHRRKMGWDKFLPSHGLVTWRVDFYKPAWEENVVNANEYKRMMYSSVGNNAVIDIEGKDVINVVENGSIVTFSYVVDPDAISWHEGIEETTVQSSNPQIFKYIKDGQIFIRRGDNIYTPQGQKAY